MKYNLTSHGKLKLRQVTWFAANCSASDYGIAKFFVNKFFAGAMNPRKL